MASNSGDRPASGSGERPAGGNGDRPVSASSVTPGRSLRAEFLIDPEVVFLNHGSFGACPRPVFETYQAWQVELERQPVEFLSRRYTDLMRTAREALAAFVGTSGDNLVYVPNATTGVNIVARGLELGPGDQVLTTDHEYGACDRIWRYMCGRRGATYDRAMVTIPVTTADAAVEEIWSLVDEQTRVLFVSHITSVTALCMPVEELCRRARAAGIITIVDGAHAPGQIELSLDELGADFYVGNCHKWLCSPKGAGFLYARPEVQDLVEPLIVGWGWETERPGTSPYVDLLEYTGTKDIAAYLSVPAAIEYQAQRDWPAVRERCHGLLARARQRLLELEGFSATHPDDPAWYRQMATVCIPPAEPESLMQRLYDRHRIEALVHDWNALTLLRVCVQGYNERSDIDALVEAMAEWVSES